MFTASPLTAREPELLVARESQLELVVEATAAGGASLVHARRGMGKTSLLNLAASQLSERGHRIFAVSASLATDGPGLMELLADRVGEPRQEWVEDPRLAGGWRLGGRSVSRPTDGGRLLAAVDRIRDGLWDAYDPPPPDRPPVLLVDDLPGQMLDRVFGLARDALWSLRCGWVVACDEADAAAMTDRAALFFDQLIDLAPLDASEAERVLRGRAPGVLQQDLVDRLVAASDGTPRSIVMAARQALGPAGTRPDRPAAEAAARRAQAQARLAELGRSPSMLVAVAQGLGGTVSASDPRLLEQLGWSRGRAAQVLKQLEENGFATSSDARPSGAGRPRTMYRLSEELR